MPNEATTKITTNGAAKACSDLAEDAAKWVAKQGTDEAAAVEKRGKSTVTFSKMRKCEWDPSTGDWTIFWRGAEIGSIEKFSDAEDVGHLTMVWKYTVESYEVTLYTDSEQGYADRTFEVKRHGGCPRATLAAAKQWARDRVQRTVDEPERTVPIQLGRSVQSVV